LGRKIDRQNIRSGDKKVINIDWGVVLGMSYLIGVFINGLIDWFMED
jgi:hypothetical protein